MQGDISLTTLTHRYATGLILSRQREQFDVTVQLVDPLENYSVYVGISRFVGRSLLMRQTGTFSSH